MNPTLDLRDLHVSYAYTTAVRLLSLDRVTPLWPALGLRIDDVEEVKTEMDALERWGQAEVLGPHGFDLAPLGADPARKPQPVMSTT